MTLRHPVLHTLWDKQGNVSRSSRDVSEETRTTSRELVLHLASSRDVSGLAYSCTTHIPFRILHLRNPPNRETQIPWYLAVQTQVETLDSFESVPRNLDILLWWILGCSIFSGICHGHHMYLIGIHISFKLSTDRQAHVLCLWYGWACILMGMRVVDTDMHAHVWCLW